MKISLVDRMQLILMQNVTFAMHCCRATAERERTCAVLADVLRVGLAELVNGVHDVLHAAGIPHGLG